MINLFFSFAVFIFGLIIGSFLNCVIHRLGLPNFSMKNLGGRSFCPHCKQTLNWQDLIPVLSFFILRGRCRYCQKKISWQYPLVELATGFIFVLISLTVSNASISNIFTPVNLLLTIFLAIISSFLIIIFVYDLKHYIIPDKIIYPAIIIALIFNFPARLASQSEAGRQFLISKQFLIFNYLILSALGAAAFFLTIVLISKGRWMGMGDVKLAFLMGLLLGFPNILVALFSAFFIGAIIGIGLIITGKKKLKSEIPFGPFLVSGTFLAMFFGEKLIDWYLSLFF